MASKTILLDKSVSSQFRIGQKATLIETGEGRTYRVGDVILRHIKGDSPEKSVWIAKVYANIKEQGFRIPKPIKTVDGNYITTDGWTAWTFLEGGHTYQGMIPQMIESIESFHRAMNNVPRPDFFDEDNPYRRADKYAWNETIPKIIHPKIKPLVEQLHSLIKPIKNVNCQVIHGDLGPENILLSPSLKPGIIDLAPYWRPVEFAQAIFAYWIGPWENNLEVLKYFKGIYEFDQM
ncbi:MAG: aminoglycoside phosphotransferase family protein, partial [bacterium]|nr:aminoglycoside phosphotransferase family protein [bacterium]